MNEPIRKNISSNNGSSTVGARSDGSETGPFPWRASFPRTDFKPADLKIPPELEVPLNKIDGPDCFPPFVLLGKRVDSSFRRTDEGVVIEYEWPRHSSSPVAKIETLNGNRLMVEEIRNGVSLGLTCGPGATFGKAFSYRILSKAFRDMLWITTEGVLPMSRDSWEDYLGRELPERFGVAYTPQVPRRYRVVEHPAGILRALAIPCLAGDSGFFGEALARYLSRPDAYVQPWLPERLAHGSFSHRSAVVEWQRPGREPCREGLELKLFVGPWRAAIELVEAIAECGWDFRNPCLPAAVVCFPQELLRPLSYNVERCVTHLPVLLPPQEALGGTDGTRPLPLGDVAFRERGGQPALLRRLDAAVEANYRKARSRRRPRVISAGGGSGLLPVALSRPASPEAPAVPVLFVLGKRGLDPSCASQWPPFARLSRNHLPLVDVARHGDDFFFVVPNLPFENECHDKEGFYHLLPDIVRYVEEEYGTAWLVERCSLTVGISPPPLVPYPDPVGLRRSGW